VEDYVRTVGQEISLVDEDGIDPRYTNTGRLHPSIDRLQRAYKRDDPPPERVKPIPLQLIRHAVDANRFGTDLQKAIADLILIGLFYLLRPGEHTYDRENTHPFRLQDTSFQSTLSAVNGSIVTQAELDAADRVHLCFTTQKNGEKGEALTHGDTDDAFISPLKAVRRRVEHLRTHHASPNTPLHTVFLPNGKTTNVRAGMITNALRASCAVLGSDLGISASEISARALRAAGAMALLRAKIDPSLIRLQGRWKSWTMLRYLHRSATHTTDFAQRMMIGGVFVLSQHATLPDDATALLSASA
jgi:hypothetical protein